MKGMLFGGCSFTWGQGLYFYSDLLDVKYPENENVFIKKNITDAQVRFKNVLHYPRLVVNYFNTFEVTKKDNGGSEDVTFDFFDNVFKDDLLGGYEKYNYHDFDYIVIQLSQIWRNKFFYDKKNPNNFINVPINNISDIEKVYPRFLEWFYSGDKTLEDCQESLIKQQFIRLKKKVIFYEEKGIKVRILSWQDDLITSILEDSYLSERFIKLKYKNKEYLTIQSLQNENENMVIKTDFDNFVGNPPLDHHPSKLCHQVIAKNIINNIKKDLK
jgi:hypothetical protein